MANIVDIAELPEAEMMNELQKLPHAHFKQFKNLPDVVAKKIFKDYHRRWNSLDMRAKELETLAEKLKFEDNSVEDNRYDIMSELRDKAMQGFEILEEHTERKVPFGHRLVLEAKMLMAMSEAFDRCEAIINDFYGKDEVFANNERDELRLDIRLLDACYTDVHTSLLKSYLDMDW